MTEPMSAVVPTRPHLSPTEQDSTEHHRRGIADAPSQSPFGANRPVAIKVYRTAGEEVAAYYRRMVDSEYEAHLEALKAEMRADYEYRQGELERWRERMVRRMCEGLE